MTEYWQSLDKKFCDTCKCWLSDNRSSIEFHENGKRHKENIQKRLSDIQKKTRKQEKDDKKTNRDMRKIEEAAAAAYSMDAANPDITRKIELYREEMEKESGGGTTGVDGEDTKKNSKKDGKDLLPKPKILHREEKPNKNSSTTATPSYTSKGGLTNLGHTSGGLDLELPPKNVPLLPKIFAEKTKRQNHHRLPILKKGL